MGPKEFMDHLQRHKNELLPEFRKIWEGAGFRTLGTWEEVFRGTQMANYAFGFGYVRAGFKA
jgi:hypothetical protein